MFDKKNKNEAASKSPYLDAKRHYADRMQETTAMNLWLKVIVIISL